MFTILAAILLATAFDADMTVQQMRETGVAKLSSKEKKAFGQWLETRYTRKTPPPVAAKTDKPPTIEENLKNGRFIRLSNHTLWEINPSDTLITQGWITPVEIKIEQNSGDPTYPYTLTNTLTGSSVRARQAQSVESEPKIQRTP